MWLAIVSAENVRLEEHEGCHYENIHLLQINHDKIVKRQEISQLRN